MSSLDQAFIKAYQRTPRTVPTAQAYEASPPLTDALADPYCDAPLEALPTAQDAWYGPVARYRVDEPHVASIPALLPANDSRSPSAYSDLAYVGPYDALVPQPTATPNGPQYAAAPASRLPEQAPLPTLDDAATTPRLSPPPVAPEPTVRAEPAPSESRSPAVALVGQPFQADVPIAPVVDQPFQADVRSAPAAPPQTQDALQTAAALRMPPPLELPSIFRGADSPEPEPEADAVKRFSPDWEVDHFLWPAICEQLLAAEATYFQHVGERLREATAQVAHVLMITGCRRGEGRTTLSLCLARCAARAGVRVALLDADFKNPQLGARLGMEIPCGWSQVLHGQAPLHEAAVASVADQLALFPLAETDAVDVEPGDERLLALLRQISAEYPLVVVDAGPLGAEGRHPFAGADGSPVNAAIVVRDMRYTTERKVLATAEHLERSGIPAVGIAENFVESGD